MVRENIVLKNKERFLDKHEISKSKLENAIMKATAKLKLEAEVHGIAFPGTCSKDMKYIYGENNNWECGMYTGCFWLAYELTGDAFFRDIAEQMGQSYRYRIDNLIAMDDHDVGFVFSPSEVAEYKVTGNENAKKIALDATKYFYDNSYSKEGKFIIRAFKMWDEGRGCRTMMDSMMNAPLLFWAGEQTGNKDYTQAAIDHVNTTAKYLIREDASSFHHYQFDPKTAKPVKGITFQGYSDDSCWGRGHSWGVYGFPIAYSYTKDESLKKLHRDVTYYMLNKLPTDCIPYWDYIFEEGSTAPRDSSCGAISACGLLEMIKYLNDDDEDKIIFESAANQMMEAIIDKCTDEGDYSGLINHVTHAVPQKQGIDECAVYGDYFYLEALLRLTKPDWKKYW